MVQHLTFYRPLRDQVAGYLLRSETGIKALLTERLALSVEHRFPGDRLLKAGLIINF